MSVIFTVVWKCGDRYRERIRWKGGSELGVKDGDRIGLRFRLYHAKRYFVDFK